jgi:L-lactate dehydrogenase complex protein LldG
MSEGRQRILGGIRRSLHRGPLGEEQRAALDAHLRNHPRGPVPARGQLDASGRVDLFQQMAEEVHATVRRLPDWSGVPVAVAEYLREHNHPTEVRVAPHPDLTGLNWQDGGSLLSVSEGAGDPDIAVGVSRAFAGVAETGTLILRSGPDSPTTLNFLPATHIVAVRADEICGPFEDAWDRLRERLGDGSFPRTVNMITGPSRTADIEQTLQLGAHGPMDLHILVIGDAGG